jgi:hypothetical protein
MVIQFAAWKHHTLLTQGIAKGFIYFQTNEQQNMAEVIG